jgi:4a-hydroxytetrahydrobiopterin dehydratase
MSFFLNKKCLPVSLNAAPLSPKCSQAQLKELSFGWELQNNIFIKKSFTFSSFDKALKFVEEVAQLAKLENHHPAILLDYKNVTLSITTHRVKGLTDNDFILAYKIDAIFLTFHEKS